MIFIRIRLTMWRIPILLVWNIWQISFFLRIRFQRFPLKCIRYFYKYILEFGEILILKSEILSGTEQNGRAALLNFLRRRLCLLQFPLKLLLRQSCKVAKFEAHSWCRWLTFTKIYSTLHLYRTQVWSLPCLVSKSLTPSSCWILFKLDFFKLLIAVICICQKLYLDLLKFIHGFLKDV